MNLKHCICVSGVVISCISCTRKEVEFIPDQQDYKRVQRLFCLPDKHHLQIATEESAVPGTTHSHHYRSYWVVIIERFKPSLEECGWELKKRKLAGKIHRMESGPNWWRYGTFEMENYWEKPLFKPDGVTTVGAAVLYINPNVEAKTLNYYILMDYMYPEWEEGI